MSSSRAERFQEVGVEDAAKGQLLEEGRPNEGREAQPDRHLPGGERRDVAVLDGLARDEGGDDNEDDRRQGQGRRYGDAQGAAPQEGPAGQAQRFEAQAAASEGDPQDRGEKGEVGEQEEAEPEIVGWQRGEIAVRDQNDRQEDGTPGL